MCLDLNENYHKVIAKRDITVYKTIMYDNGILITSYMHSVIKIGHTYKSRIVINPTLNSIGIGIHSFVKLSDTILVARNFNEIVVKCAIPKGSTYYVGTFTHKSIASNQLKYIKILKDYSNMSNKYSRINNF